MDDIDRANDHAQKELEAAIAAARGVMPADRRSADTCAECGNEISSARQHAVPGCTMCTQCAEDWERRIRLGL